MTPTTYALVALIGVAVGAALGVIVTAWRRDRRISALETENLRLTNQLALVAYEQLGRHSVEHFASAPPAADATPDTPPQPVYAQFADDWPGELTQPIPLGER
jgi:hypothetical protein